MQLKLHFIPTESIEGNTMAHLVIAYFLINRVLNDLRVYREWWFVWQTINFNILYTFTREFALSVTQNSTVLSLFVYSVSLVFYFRLKRQY